MKARRPGPRGKPRPGSPFSIIRLRLILAASAALAAPARPADTNVPCGPPGSVPRLEPEYAAERIAQERALASGNISHCGYALARACLDWESDRGDAGRHAFLMAQSFCGDSPAAVRGEIASAFARARYAEAYAAFDRHRSRGGADSAAAAAYGPAALAGLALSPYARAGSAAGDGPGTGWDPVRARRLSLLPGLGFLYLGEPKAALSHALTSFAFGALAGWSGYRAFSAPARNERWVAALDFGLITAFFLQRYYLGGIREAGRLAREKNRARARADVAALAGAVDPFAAP